MDPDTLLIQFSFPFRLKTIFEHVRTYLNKYQDLLKYLQFSPHFLRCCIEVPVNPGIVLLLIGVRKKKYA